jgi:hypothetical protein
MAVDTVQALGFFNGLQPRALRADRLFRIYVSPKMLAGAYLAGQIYDEQSAALQLQSAGLFLYPLVRRWLARRREREALYDTLNPFSPLFLEQDARNFHIPRSEVARTHLRRNRSLWTAFNVGKVEVEFLDGSVRRFILVGYQQVEEIFSLMKTFDPDIEATGKSKSLPQPKGLAPAQRQLLLVLMGLMLLGFAIFFGYAWWGGRGNAPKLLPLAIVNSLAAIWCFLMAWRTGRNKPRPGGEA